MEVHFDARETDLLMGILEHRLEDLRREIQHTDSRAFKAALKEDETLIESLQVKLKAPADIGI